MWTEFDVAPDGDCLFLATVHALLHASGKGLHASDRARARVKASVPWLRARVADTLAGWYARDRDFAAIARAELAAEPAINHANGSRVSNVRTYLARLRQPRRIWGGNMELNALAHVVSRVIHVYVRGGGDYVLRYEAASRDPRAAAAARQHPPLRLVYVDGNHYRVLYRDEHATWRMGVLAERKRRLLREMGGHPGRDAVFNMHRHLDRQLDVNFDAGVAAHLHRHGRMPARANRAAIRAAVSRAWRAKN